MTEIINSIKESLGILLICISLFSCSYLSNMCFGLWNNIGRLKESFNLSKFITSICKLLAFVVGLSLYGIVISIIPIAIKYIGVDIPSATLEILTVSAIVIVFFNSTLAYLKEAKNKITIILNSGEVKSISDEGRE